MRMRLALTHSLPRGVLQIMLELHGCFINILLPLEEKPSVTQENGHLKIHTDHGYDTS
jgi:hypothetical protein